MDSTDPKVAKAGIEVRTGRKWQTVEDQIKLVEVVTQGRARQIVSAFPDWHCQRGEALPGSRGDESMIEEERSSMVVSIGQQGALFKVGQCTGEAGDIWLICGKLSPTASSSMSRGFTTCFPVHQSLDTGMSAVFEA